MICNRILLTSLLNNLLVVTLLVGTSSQELFAQTPNPIHERIKKQAEEANQAGDHQKAIDLASSILRQNSSDHVALYIRASAQVELGSKQGDQKLVRAGISDARTAIGLKRNDNAMYHLPYLYGMTQLARLESKPVHAEVAVKVASDAAKRAGLSNSDKANIIYQRGLAHAALGKLDLTVQDYEEVIQLSPNHAGALLTVADMYAAQGNTEKAISSFDRAQKALPKNPLVLNNKAMFLQQQGKAQEAVNIFTEAMQLDPKFFMAYTNRGFTLLQAGNTVDAEKDFTSSLQINSNQTIAYGLRGTARLAQGKTDAAIQDHRQVIQMTPKNPVAHADLGFALFFSKMYAESAKAFQDALALNTEFRHLNPWLYVALTRAGDSEAAATLFKQIGKQEGEEKDWGDHLLAYVAGKLSEEDLLAATKNKEEKITKDRLCETHYFAGLNLLAQGKAAEAKKRFTQSVETGSKHLSAFRGAEFGLK